MSTEPKSERSRSTTPSRRVVSLLPSPEQERLWTPEPDCPLAHLAAPLKYPSDCYRDPRSGMTIPKDVVKNLEWRKRIKERADEDPGFASGLLTLCRQSPILFVNLFVDTLRIHEFTADGERRPSEFRRRPLVTWPCQDRAILQLHEAWKNGKNVRVVKSREMGWTWLLIAYDLFHFTLFEDRQILWGSRKEELLWKVGDNDTVFAKFEFAIGRLPTFLTPEPIKCNERLFYNPATKGKISGEATNPNFGRGGRNDLVRIDEAAAVDILDSIEMAVRANGPTTMLSTAKAGSYFAALRTSPAYIQLRMPWYEHPEKGLGRKDLPNDEFEVYVTSPWEKKERASCNPRMYAQEVAMNEGRAGDMVFSPEMLRRARVEALKPTHVGTIEFANSGGNGNTQSPTSEPEELAEADERLMRRQTHLIRWDEDVHRKSGEWMLWCDLEPDANGNMRPPQDRFYAMFCAPGDGRRSANSAIVVMDADTGEQVGEWCSSRYGSRDAGRILCAAALWFGGPRYPLVGWENNGMGGNVTEILAKRLKYPNCYRARLTGRAGADPLTQRLGWTATGHKKPVLIDNFADAWSSGRLTIRSTALIDEAATFIVLEDGKVAQAEKADMTTGAREAHGDRVIAGAGCWLMVCESPKTVRLSRVDDGPSDPVLSFAGRLKATRREEELSKRPRWRTVRA